MLKTVKQMKITFAFASLLVLLAVSLILFVAQFALAQTTDTSVQTVPREARQAEQAERRETRADDIEAKRAEIADRREAQRAALPEQAQERISSMAETIAARLATAITRLSDLSTRIRERADALNTRGIDTTDAVAALDRADALLRDASAMLDSIDVDVAYVVTSDTPRNDWADLRAQLRTVRDALIDAHALLREAIASLKSSIRAANDGTN